MADPRGIRLNNPGHLRHGPAWRGLTPVQDDPHYARFSEPLWGLRALMRVLLTYRRRHGLDTVHRMLHRWAPPRGAHPDGTPYTQDTASYVRHVAARLGVDPHAPVPLEDPAVLADLARAIVRHECGTPPPSRPPDWYYTAAYTQAARLALAP